MFAKSPQPLQAAKASPISPVADVIDEIRRGRMIVLMDDEDRENEGDIVVAAEKVTVEQVNFMIRHARGLICMPITEDRMQKLGLRMMVPENTAPLGTGFTVSIDSRSSTAGGVTAADRCRTLRQAADPTSEASDFVIPGHIFPLRAREGGVLVRTGQTEGSVDLCRLAGLEPAGVICEILNENGTMARLPDLVRFAETHGLKISTVADLIQYRLQNESLVRRIASARLPTKYGGEFTAHVYCSSVEEGEHIALVKGSIDPERPLLVRAHAEYLPGDVFASVQRNTGDVLHRAMARIAAEENGVLLYVRRHRRGAEMLAEAGGGPATTNPTARLASFKDYGIGAQILRDLGVRRIRLLTNSPFRLPNLAGYGLEVVEVVSI
ncbi:MAG TPA: 3,4-dihydroxy-2-butanone-4-phosphate synthase [Candidatus Limnocylindrales bacterium]|nr:3,4-dihydroxy-2-butanone-4-phosphate synthase [Candidatus Limnocylindrales bacterium]